MTPVVSGGEVTTMSRGRPPKAPEDRAVQLPVRLSPWLLARVRVRAAERRMTLTEFVTLALRNELDS